MEFKSVVVQHGGQAPDNSSQIVEMRGRCLQTLTRVLDAKDPAARISAFRAAKLASAVGQLIGLDDEFVRRVELGGMLHDIGKLGIPDYILHKTGALSDEEVEIVQRHPEVGVGIISPLLGTESVILAVVLHHHERWDGEGYPGRLLGHAIPIEARLISAADAFIAMVSERPYRKALTHHEALKNLEAGAGTQWDPDVIAALLTLPIDKADDIAHQAPTV